MGGRGKDGGVVSKTVAEWQDDEERISEESIPEEGIPEEGIPEDAGADDPGDAGGDAVGTGRTIPDLEGLDRMVEQLDEPLDPASGADQQASSVGLSGAGEENDVPFRVIPYLRFQAGLNAAGVGYMLNNSVDGVGSLAKKAATRTKAAVKTARETRDKVAEDPKFKAAVNAGREAERKAVVVGGLALGAGVVAGSELAKVKPAERGRERKLFE